MRTRKAFVVAEVPMYWPRVAQSTVLSEQHGPLSRLGHLAWSPGLNTESSSSSSILILWTCLDVTLSRAYIRPERRQ